MTTLNGSWQTIASSRSDASPNYNILFELQAYCTQSVTGNYSDVHTRLLMTNSTGWLSASSYSIGLSGTQDYTGSNLYIGIETRVMREGSYRVAHNNDGTASTTVGCWYNATYGPSFSAYPTVTLPTIPRASTASANPNPLVIGSSGATVAINTNRKAAFTHTLTLTCGSWTSTQTGIAESTTFEIPYSIIGQFADNSKTATCTITCVTYNGSTNIGTKESTFTLQIDTESDHPNIGTITVEDTNTRTSAIVGAETFIYGISTLSATIPLTVSGSYTELASAVVTCGTKSQTYSLSGTSQTITFTFDKVDYNSLTVKVTDKRGNSVSATKSYTLMPYQPVTATASVGRTSATGSTAVGQVSGIAYGGNYGNASNSLTISYKFKRSTDSTWTDGAQTYTKSLSEGQQSYTEAITFADSFDYQYQYDIQIIVNDLFNTATYTCQLMQGLPIISWDETEVDVWGDLHIHYREEPNKYQNILDGFDAVLAHNGQKNLFLTTGTTTTSNGVTFTVNDDGTITAARTASSTQNAEYDLTVPSSLYGKTVILNGCPSGGDDSNTYRMFFLVNGSRQATDYGNGATYTIPSSPTSCVVRINVFKKFNSTATFKPMIRDARIASDTFVPSVITRTINKSVSFGTCDFTFTKLGKLAIVYARFVTTSSYTVGDKTILSGSELPTDLRPMHDIDTIIARQNTGQQGLGSLRFQTNGEVIYGVDIAGVSGVVIATSIAYFTL